MTPQKIKFWIKEAILEHLGEQDADDPLNVDKIVEVFYAAHETRFRLRAMLEAVQISPSHDINPVCLSDLDAAFVDINLSSIL